MKKLLLILLCLPFIGLGNAKLKLKLNYCKEYKRACDLGDCFAYDFLCSKWAKD